MFDPQVRLEFPDLSLVNWFEHKKTENGINGVIDWRATINPQVKAVLVQALSSGYIFAPSQP